jgi:hypothetical protein
MVKVTVAELEQLLTLIKKTSQDVHVLVREDGMGLSIQFQNVENQITNVQIYDENSKMFAKVTSSETLGQTLAKLKK